MSDRIFFFFFFFLAGRLSLVIISDRKFVALGSKALELDHYWMEAERGSKYLWLGV